MLMDGNEKTSEGCRPLLPGFQKCGQSLEDNDLGDRDVSKS